MSHRSQILIVEDSDTQALMMQALLTEAGFAVHRSASAEEAMEYLQEHWPDLVVVDYHLPRMSGAEFCRQLRIGSGMEAISILMLTDDAETEVEHQGLESGADDHLRKSAGDDVLLARIEALLRVSRPRSMLRAVPSHYFRSRNILIIDDSPTFLTFLAQALEGEGYGVRAFSDPRAALVLIEEQKCTDGLATPEVSAEEQIDCVVVDLVMPELDGIEVCRRLNVMRRNVHTWLPILMVTSHDSNEDMMRALEAGADDFVAKSHDTALLNARIRALLRRKILHDEHERILTEFRSKELEVVQARAEQRAAMARAELVEELERTNEELRRTHTQLVQSTKMAALGELVAGVAHEINNPVSYTLAHVQTVARALDTIVEDSETIVSESARKRITKARRRADEAADGLERVAELVVKLRTFSRLDEGEFKQANLKDCIEATLPLVKHRLGEGIRVVTDFTDDNELYCAPGMLNQVILNFLTNAIDALEGEGEIRIETSRTEKWFCLRVADTGPGLAPDAQERLFEPFFTTKDIGEGTGLGLAISYQIVQSHHGGIEARNRKEGGAEFIVSIPTNLTEAGHEHQRTK